jgi:hypothetical protein
MSTCSSSLSNQDVLNIPVLGMVQGPGVDRLDAAGGEGDLVWPFLDNFHNSHIEALVDWQYERTTKCLWKFITF